MILVQQAKLLMLSSTQYFQNVDGIKSLGVDLKANGKFSEQTELTCRSSELEYAKFYSGKKHDCLVIMIDCSTRDLFKVSTTNCIGTMKEDFPLKTRETFKLHNNKAFQVSTRSPRLWKEKSSIFYVFTIKCIFSYKRK